MGGYPCGCGIHSLAGTRLGSEIADREIKTHTRLKPVGSRRIMLRNLFARHSELMRNLVNRLLWLHLVVVALDTFHGGYRQLRNRPIYANTHHRARNERSHSCPQPLYPIDFHLFSNYPTAKRLPQQR
jgi:hypothetical protein